MADVVVVKAEDGFGGGQIDVRLTQTRLDPQSGS